MNEYISREEVYQRLHEAGGCDATEEWSKGYDEAIGVAIGIIEDAPAADVAPVVHGHWIYKYSYTDQESFHSICSNCKEAIKSTRNYKCYDYDPHCGAKMDEEADNASKE